MFPSSQDAVDFHMHTTHSDGTYSPEELMRACRDKNLVCVSVTDHDTMSSFEACESEAQKLGIELVSGIEISAIFEPGTMHILGYFLDPNHPELKTAIENIQQVRRDRNSNIIKKLNEAGIEITMEEVIEEATFAENAGFRHARENEQSSRFSSSQAGIQQSLHAWRCLTPLSLQKQIGRPHFAKVLVKKKAVKNTQEAFQKYLGKGCSAYLDTQKLTPEEAVFLINRDGGIAYISHP